MAENTVEVREGGQTRGVRLSSRMEFSDQIYILVERYGGEKVFVNGRSVEERNPVLLPPPKNMRPEPWLPRDPGPVVL